MEPELFEVLFELALLDSDKAILPTNREDNVLDYPDSSLEKAA